MIKPHYIGVISQDRMHYLAFNAYPFTVDNAKLEDTFFLAGADKLRDYISSVLGRK
jgi:hypothetical protein